METGSWDHSEAAQSLAAPALWLLVFDFLARPLRLFLGDKLQKLSPGSRIRLRRRRAQSRTPMSAS
jgi:hypothetical protein